MHGPFNKYGFDSGIDDSLRLKENGRWEFNLMAEWPSTFQFNIWGINPDGKPDQTWVLGDVDNDTVLDRMPPSSLAQTLVNVSRVPPFPYLAYRISLDDGNYRYELIPVGSRWQQLTLYLLLAILPVALGAASVWAFMKSFYKVKFNPIGVTEKRPLVPLALRRRFARLKSNGSKADVGLLGNYTSVNPSALTVGTTGGTPARRAVLIATMEYDIEDWGIKIKIGGLGVMAQLMVSFPPSN